MDSVKIGSIVYSNGKNNFSLKSAKVIGVDVVRDSDGVGTWIKLSDGGEGRSITAEVFFKNYTDVPPFFRMGFTYRNGNSAADRFEIVELLKSDNPPAGHADGMYAVAKRHESDGAYSYIILDESNFRYMERV